MQVLFCHQYLSASNLFHGSFIDYLFSVFLNSKIFSSSQSAAFLCETLLRCFFSVFFFYIFWTFSNSSVIVTIDTFNTWLPLLATFTLYCCNKVSSQIVIEAKVEFFLPLLNCFQLCFFRNYYFTVKQEKDWPQKIMITKRYFSEISRRFQSVRISANNLCINTRKMCVIGIKDQVIFKTEQNQKQSPWGVLNTSPTPPPDWFWQL